MHELQDSYLGLLRVSENSQAPRSRCRGCRLCPAIPYGPACLAFLCDVTNSVSTSLSCSCQAKLRPLFSNVTFGKLGCSVRMQKFIELAEDCQLHKYCLQYTKITYKKNTVNNLKLPLDALNYAALINKEHGQRNYLFQGNILSLVCRVTSMYFCITTHKKYLLQAPQYKHPYSQPLTMLIHQTSLFQFCTLPRAFFYF